MKNNFLKNICTSLGKNNKPTYVVMTIAVVKGICRPMFTMMDKKEDKETKKYTAIREGLTEVIAIPTYFFCGEVAGKMSKLRPAEKQSVANKNLMFIGVCTAAIFVIPALCSLAIKPFMKMIQNKNQSKKEEPTRFGNVNYVSMNPPCVRKNNFTSLNTFSSRVNYGMKVGGV